MISMAILRRDLDGLFSTVRSRCDSYRVVDVGSHVAKEIENSIDNFYDRWFATWTVAIGEGDQKALPPYVEILVTHTRLSTYSGVINHPTAPLEVKRLFRAAALSSALNVMRAAIQGEGRLKSMPNNTAIMISFAACVALNLSGGNSGLAPSVRSLIEETADVLERIGSTPRHRQGMSVFYGKYLREIVRNAPAMPLATYSSKPSIAFEAISQPQVASQGQTSMVLTPIHPTMTIQYQPSSMWNSNLQFSAMSDNEIIETVLRAGNDYDMPLSELPLEDTTGFMWDNLMSGPEFGF